MPMPMSLLFTALFLAARSYGEQGVDSIPGNQVLVFRITMVSA